MDPIATHPEIDAPAPAPAGNPAPEAPQTFARDERGQISVLFMFGTLTMVLLAGVIFNTANSAIRKVEMQNAADSAALATGSWVARGMNLVAFNNCGMGDVLAVMVTSRALLETAQLMSQIIVPAIGSALSSNPFTAAVGAYILGYELTVWTTIRSIMEAVDPVINQAQSGIGWLILKGLDYVNQAIKTVMGPFAGAQALAFAKQNRADLGFVIPGLGIAGEAPVPVPMLPIGRAEPKHIANRAAEVCVFGPLQAVVVPAMLIAPLVAVAGIATYAVMVVLNFASLGADANPDSGSNAAALEHLRNNPDQAMELIRKDRHGEDEMPFPPGFTDDDGPILKQWLSEQPQEFQDQFTRPPDGDHDSEWIDLDALVAHLETDNDKAAEVAARIQQEEANQELEDAGVDPQTGSYSGGGVFTPPLKWEDAGSEPPRPMMLDDEPSMSPSDETTEDPDLKKVYKYLQYLAIAQAEMKNPVIGPQRMQTPNNVGWLTYGQANVFNPTKWHMFSQDWRVKMVQARLLDEKLSFIPGFSSGDNGESADFVNTH